MDAKTLFDVAKYLGEQAEKMALVERVILGKAESPYAPNADFPTIGGGTNIYTGSVPSYGPVPTEFQAANTYGTRPDIGSPGWQATLRTYALRDGKVDANQYVKDRGLVCIWPDERQAWDVA